MQKTMKNPFIHRVIQAASQSQVRAPGVNPQFSIGGVTTKPTSLFLSALQMESRLCYYRCKRWSTAVSTDTTEGEALKVAPTRLTTLAIGLSLLGAGALARELGAREARERIAKAVGLENADRVHIKSINGGSGREAIVEATFDGTFRMTSDKSGNWTVAEVRTGDRCWESVDLIRTAVRKEKILRTTADLRTLATALESFRREHGSYVTAASGAALLDALSPHYIDTILRLDAWSHEFEYHGSQAGYRLASLGPDGKPGTGDEIVVENGKLVKGANE